MKPKTNYIFAITIFILVSPTYEDIIGVRLRGGATPGQGKVEVKLGRQWGAVCDDHWTYKEASVVCKQLGYEKAAEALRNSYYGEARGPIWIKKVRCSGFESDLAKCQYEELKTKRESLYENVDEIKFCSYRQQAAVKCVEAKHNDALLIHLGWQQVSAGPSGRRSRLVRVRRNNRWLPICADTWSSKEAIVACKQAGLGFAAVVEKCSFVRQITSSNKSRLVVTELNCHGNESSLQECKMKTKQKRCAEYSSVYCSPRAPDISVNITILEPSVKIIQRVEKDMVCAKEEECMSASGLSKSFDQLTNSTFSRKLLVFTSLVQNFGNADFLPPKVEGGWFYHACHKHYHSMNDFATYELRDHNSKIVEVGHKVSFCLRDSTCVNSKDIKYGCSEDLKILYQGISVGCGDLYSNKIDCQWIDVTDVPDGEYFLEVRSNPFHTVAEQDYTNNFIVCKVVIAGVTALARNCHCPFDFV